MNSKPEGTKEEDARIMQAVRKIVAKGNNAEIKRQKDGNLCVMEVKKSIIA